MESKIKILHIAKVLAGVGTSLELIAENIDEERFELILIRDIEENAKPLLYNSGKLVKTYCLELQREIQPGNDLRFLKKSISIVKKEKPQLIHCHSAKGGIIGRALGSLTRIPTFFTPQAFSFLSAENKFKRSLFQTIENAFGLTNSFLIACSDSEAIRALKDTRYPKERIYVVDNFLPEPQEEPDFNFESDFICSIGRPSFQKNTMFLLKVFKDIHKRLPHIKLYILGVGHYSPDLLKSKKFIQENNLTQAVKLFEWTSRNETLTILKKSLLYVSFARYEGLSFAVLEAMANGKPCLLSDVDGNRDCIKDGKGGMLFNLDTSSTEVAESIIPIINDQDKLCEMGKESFQQFLKYFTAKGNISKLEGLYIQHAKKHS